MISSNYNHKQLQSESKVLITKFWFENESEKCETVCIEKQGRQEKSGDRPKHMCVIGVAE